MMSDVQSSELSTHYTTSLLRIQDSLKWLIASAGAAAAFVIGGLPFGGVPTGHVSFARGSVLVISAVAGLVMILLLLVSAARIQTLKRLTADDITNLEKDAKVGPL